MSGEGARRIRLRATGIVQGVGFRPFVHRLAVSLDLTGYVRNDEAGVTLEVEGPGPAVAAFRERFVRELPPLALVDSCETTELETRGDTVFEIRGSAHGAPPTAQVAPDAATCADCLRELFDPGDRRFRYPFTNCTNCGPRFTIVRGIPYDRPNTTMSAFRMCDACRAEYEDPGDRRFHAQPNACPVCGPTLRLATPGQTGEEELDFETDDPLVRARDLLRAGGILAVKGLGGYHLACDASNDEAVRRLRRRKHREDKPFALMAPDLADARRLVDLDPVEAGLLESHERPIVLARRLPDANVADAVAPGFPELGVMLPYTPLHHLLLSDTGSALVMTSGNVSDDPIAYRDDEAVARLRTIAYRDDEALARLRTIADAFLVHDRPIHTRTDDSIVRVVTIGDERRPVMLRRSRGWVPRAVELPESGERSVLAVGAHLKNTFCLAASGRARMGPHVGDLENYETLRSFEEGIAHFETLFEIEADIVARDLHPDYLSTKYAERRRQADGSLVCEVQHHHAHLAACLAEHGRAGPAVGAIFDGTGYGPDGTVWGGEILLGDLAEFERVGHLWPVRLPGGAAAVREPWRMACAWLCALGDDAPELPAALAATVDPVAWAAVVALVRSGMNSPLTTSAGRLFDAVSALCGVRPVSHYEGQAAIELEALAHAAAEGAPAGSSAVQAVRAPGDAHPAVIDVRPLVERVVRDMADGAPVGGIARDFHDGIARATAGACRMAAERAGCSVVVLSGGVFQNVRLLQRTASHLDGLEVLVPRRIPPNDGGISYGQAAVAAARGRRAG